MARTQQHPWEQASSDVATWLDGIVPQLADAMKLGGRGPFTADLTNKQKLDYYNQVLFNPDGTPNAAGVQQLQARMSPQDFGTTYLAVLRYRQNGPQALSDISTGTPALNEMLGPEPEPQAALQGPPPLGPAAAQTAQRIAFAATQAAPQGGAPALPPTTPGG